MKKAAYSNDEISVRVVKGFLKLSDSQKDLILAVKDNEKKKQTVGDLSKVLRLNQSALSKMISELKYIGLLKEERAKNEKILSLSSKGAELVKDLEPNTDRLAVAFIL